MLQQGRTRAGTKADVITVVLGTWFSVGLFLDAWAHSNLTELESFFTPWHAVFYSGFSATAAWICWLVYRNYQQGRRGLNAVPVGYGPAVLALPVFAVMGVLDYTWHSILGIETDIEILFSPTHLGLAAAMIVIMATPLRTAWLDTSRDKPSFPALLSLGFCASLVLLFLQYADATVYPAEAIVERFSYEQGKSTGIVGKLTASIFVTNLVMLAPLLFAARRWTLPFGTATTVQVIVAGLSASITAFSNLGIAAALVLSGVATDLLLVKLRPSEQRVVQYRLFGFLMPLITWLFYFGGAIVLTGRFPTVTETWTGVPLVAALSGLLLAVLFVPKPVPVRL
ncbi:hypothetical protein FKR81_17840 [Lentzea tibetensis]|uniref:Uncharacterized protein n=1 Tax=Lentzea tibetensis TaxID=2591470 RepID=A0A563ETS9_9PSEU|nr:hypothetical protein [Lentzea tibetensis]TWP50938.1 hypothetical protein FKR81_17840 [Lentzea tibetensis]